MSIPDKESYMTLYKLSSSSYTTRASWVSTREYTSDPMLNESSAEFITDDIINRPKDRNFKQDQLK